MAYAFDASLEHVYLASRAGTEKVENMLDSPCVSLLWDNRTGNTADHSDGTAAMGGGVAAPLQGWFKARARYMLLARNPQLAGLLASTDVDIFCVEVTTYKLVEGYDRVTEFAPGHATTPRAQAAQTQIPSGPASSAMPAVA